MAKATTASMLWAVVCLQMAFFIILTALYVWKDSSRSTVVLQRCQLHVNNYSLANESPASVTRQLTEQTIPAQQQHRQHRQRKVGTQLHTLDYKYSLNPASSVCGSRLYLLVVVESTTYNAMERDYFRKRWKMSQYKGKTIGTVFVTAVSQMENTQDLLEYEQEMHKDILQIDFVDNYRNLTLKTMLSLRWAVDECQPFKYILKTDDDMIVNFDVLIDQLESLPENITQDLYMGLMMSHKVPIRNKADKWHVTLEEYPLDRYPDYMGGPGYVLSYQAANRVIDASYRVPFMPMEDVFVGISAERAGIQGYSSLRFSNWEIWDYYSYCWAREMAILHKADFIVREIYYYDKLINSRGFDFARWQRDDLFKTLLFAQQKVDESNEPEEFVGYPMIYKCSPFTWEMEKAKCLYKHIVKWKIPRERIIEI